MQNPSPTRFPSKHRVKSHPESFREVWYGVKGHEIRLNDRRYKVSDWVRLNEFDPESGAYSGRSIDIIIIHLRFSEGEGFPASAGLKPGFVVFDFLIVTKFNTRGARPEADADEFFNPEAN